MYFWLSNWYRFHPPVVRCLWAKRSSNLKSLYETQSTTDFYELSSSFQSFRNLFGIEYDIANIPGGGTVTELEQEVNHLAKVSVHLGYFGLQAKSRFKTYAYTMGCEGI